VTMGRRDRSGAREVIGIAQRERESISSGFSPMTPLEGEDDQQRRSVVLRWRDNSMCKEERLELGGCGG
jgi:hypothetical protein